MQRSLVFIFCLGMLTLSAYAKDDLSAFGIPAGVQPVAAALGVTTLTGAQRIVWDNRPISVTLQVGVERQVTFPAAVRLGIPNAVHERLRTQSVDGTVHWLAYEPFDVTRVQVREIPSGRTYLLDVNAVAEGGGMMPLEVVDSARLAGEPLPETFPVLGSAAAAPLPNGGIEAGTATMMPGVPTETMPAAPPAYDYVALTRFAVQQLYAPERLLPRLQLASMTRVPVRRQPAPLYRGGALRAEPYVAWTDGTLYVTAVRLSNTTAQRVVIDTRELRGQWLARTVLYAEVQPRGDQLGRDQSFVFLLSPMPFQEASR